MKISKILVGHKQKQKKKGSDIKQKITGFSGECQICSLLSKKVYFFANIGRRPNFLD